MQAINERVLSDQEQDDIDALIERIEESDDVQRVYTNI
jgi:transcriptional/translational regulatory protein YebC/TACO1